MRNASIRACVLAIALTSHVPRLKSQEWNSPRATELARRAVDRRTNQISAIASYRSTAKGYLTFLAQVGDTAILPPYVVQHTQLAVDVFWSAPGSSKQIVMGRRDTLLIPADLDYYADRFGIVQSNFPDRIRMGDGKDVADVLHPLSAGGLDAYDFALTDSLSIQIPGAERIDVYKLTFRPRDPRAPRAAGSAHVDVRNGDIVRLELSFTRAAILDSRIELLSVVLENQLVENNAWLPRRQQVEVVRTGTWMKMDVRGIIRGRWDVCCYDVTFMAPPEFFAGPAIVFAPPEVLRAHKFEGGILDALPPEMLVARDADVRAVQEQAEELLALAMRERIEGAKLSMPRLTDLVRVTRAEGFAVGAAGQARVATGIAADAAVRYGVSDDEWKGAIGVSVALPQGRGLRAFASREYADLRDVPEVSGIRNSFAAQEFGSDYTDPIDVRSAGVELTIGRWMRSRWRITGAVERHRPLAIRARPEHGVYEPLIPALAVDALRVTARAEGMSWALAGGTMRASTGIAAVRYSRDDRRDVDGVRVAAELEYDRALGVGRVAMRTIAAAASGGSLPPQSYVYFGGPTSAPGYRFDEFGARRGVSQRLEWRTTVPFPALTLGRFGRVPPRATIAPYAHAVWVDGRVRDPIGGGDVRGGRQGWYPAAGVGLEPFLGIMRIDVARGLRDGRWTFSFDLARVFWPVL